MPATNYNTMNQTQLDYVMVPNEDKDAKKDEIVPKHPETGVVDKPHYWRNLAAFWMLGLCNNYGYVVMLSAAHDILKQQDEDFEDSSRQFLGMSGSDADGIRDCNILSTGAILLADIIPSLLIKFTAPFLPFYVHIRILLCILLASGGFLTVAFSTGPWMSILGVVLTSFSSGLGECTILQYSSFYDKNVVSTWSSGTGGAGVFGSVSYAGLNKLGLRNALLIMLIVPVTMAVSFWLILTSPGANGESVLTQREVENEDKQHPVAALARKVKKMPGLMKYMIPLGLVYLFEYFINQGMFELIQYDDFFLSHSDQYVWLQVDYQIGVFLSRSSVNLVHVKRIWLMSVFQLINVFIFTSEAIFYVFPSYYIVLALTLWEGLLGGAAYVNTFYKISSEVPDEERQFSMAVTSFADSIGITLAGIFSMYAHNAICELPKPERLL